MRTNSGLSLAAGQMVRVLGCRCSQLWAVVVVVDQVFILEQSVVDEDTIAVHSPSDGSAVTSVDEVPQLLRKPNNSRTVGPSLLEDHCAIRTSFLSYSRKPWFWPNQVLDCF